MHRSPVLVLVVITLCASTKVYAQAPDPPNLIRPPNHATDVSIFPTLNWSSVVPITAYKPEVYDSATGVKVYEYEGDESIRTIEDYPLLGYGKTYKWHVMARYLTYPSAWTEYWYFTCEPDRDSLALVALYYSTNGDGWRYTERGILLPAEG